MILPDTSVWIDHFRSENATLKDHLHQYRIVTHPFIIGELALGSLMDRKRLLQSLDELPRLNTAEDEEVRHLIERRKLYSKGVGWVDAHLIASALIRPATQLWTIDVRLARAAAELGLPLHPGSLPS